MCVQVPLEFGGSVERRPESGVFKRVQNIFTRTREFYQCKCGGAELNAIFH